MNTKFMRRAFVFFLMVMLCAQVGFGQDVDTAFPDSQDEELEVLSSKLSVFVKGFRFEGNTAFSDEALAGQLEPFLNRRLSDAELEETRRALTLHYINNGYINSGAVLPDQTIGDGIITFRIIEGNLSEIVINGNGRLNTNYIESRVRKATATPLNIVDLRDQLELLRQDTNIARVNAELKPGVLPGESYLDVSLDEQDPFRLALQFSNDRAASLGAERLELLATHTNLTGNGDSLHFEYSITKHGIDDLDFADDDEYALSYALPLNEDDVTLILNYNKSDTLIIEEPFNLLNITSESERFGVTLRVPVYKTTHSEFAVSFTGDRQTNRTFLSGGLFELTAGSRGGLSKVAAFRIGQEWVSRSQDRAVAFRSTFSFGLDTLDSTQSANKNGADSRFVAWLGQLQYVKRLGEENSLLVFRVSGQLSDDSLISMEKFSVGGVDTVRGYRQNQVVRDKGIIASIETRIPLIHDTTGNGVFYIVPFFDIGVGVNHNSATPSQDLASAGVGFLLNLDNRLDAQLYWGHPFRDFDNSNDDLQDAGIHFKIVLSLF